MTNELRTLVFTRPVFTYEDLLNVVHEATRSIEEGHRSSLGERTQKYKEKTRFGALSTPVEAHYLYQKGEGGPKIVIDILTDDRDTGYSGCNALDIYFSQTAHGKYNLRYGVLTRTSNHYR